MKKCTSLFPSVLAGTCRIAGLLISSKPAPNTKISLPLVGYVVLNEQSGPFNGATSTSISVNALDVNITLGSAAGTRLIIGHANSLEVITAQRLIVTASAYGLYALALGGSSSNSTIGPLGSVAISCFGGSASGTSSGLNSSLIGSVGAINSSVSGQITPTDANATGQTNVSNTNLLSSLTQAGSVAVSVWFLGPPIDQAKYASQARIYERLSPAYARLSFWP